jgi:hypothetical protein
MRHATDGELHAYLDGALDILPEGRGDEIRDHLAACSACAERLQEEERVREAARGLLARAAPPAVEIPSFESLRAQAEARESNEDRLASAAVAALPRRRPLRGLPLAWAATVVLALGVGWMGGEIWRSVPGLRMERLSDELRREPGAAPPLQPVPGADRARLDMVPPAEAESAATGAGRGAASTPVRPTVGEAAAGPRALVIPQATSMMALAEAARRETLPVENSLAVPGLEVLSVEWGEWAPGEKVLRIRQLLSVGDTLELRYLGMLLAADAEAEAKAGARSAAEPGLGRPLAPEVLEASLPPGWNQVEMRWGEGWLVGRARLPEASLRALLLTIR